MRVLKKIIEFLISNANVYDCLPLATSVFLASKPPRARKWELAPFEQDLSSSLHECIRIH